MQNLGSAIAELGFCIQSVCDSWVLQNCHKLFDHDCTMLLRFFMSWLYLILFHFVSKSYQCSMKNGVHSWEHPYILFQIRVFIVNRLLPRMESKHGTSGINLRQREVTLECAMHSKHHLFHISIIWFDLIFFDISINLCQSFIKATSQSI